MKRDYVNPFKALSDPNRIRIMKMLTLRELCLCEVRAVLGLSNSTVSRHLTILRDAGLILDAKEGKWVNFRLNNRSQSKFIRSTIALVRGSFGDDEAVRRDAIALRRVDRKTICGI
jgi:ArsR family transcriptional regulator, arsenate/arsenite/antimonite-responsive transcriptional repressor